MRTGRIVFYDGSEINVNTIFGNKVSLTEEQLMNEVDPNLTQVDFVVDRTNYVLRYLDKDAVINNRDGIPTKLGSSNPARWVVLSEEAESDPYLIRKSVYRWTALANSLPAGPVAFDFTSDVRCVFANKYEGHFVVTHNSNSLRYSFSNGVFWSPRTLPSANNWVSGAYGNGSYVLVSDSGSNRVIYSNNFLSSFVNATGATSRQWRSVCYGNNYFVAVSYDGFKIHSTNGGVNWTETSFSGTWRGVNYGGGFDNPGRFIAVSDSGSIVYSDNPTLASWSTATISGTPRPWSSVVYGNGVWVACSTDGYITRSVDNGVNWSAPVQVGTTTISWKSIAFGAELSVDGVFVMVGNQSVAVSEDGGNTWSIVPNVINSGSADYVSVAYGKGVFIIVSGTSSNSSSVRSVL